MTLAVGRAAAGRPAAWRRLRDLGGRRGHVLELEGSIVRDGIFAEAEPIRRERLQLWRVLALLQRLGRLSDQLDGRVDRRRQRERRRRRVRR